MVNIPNLSKIKTKSTQINLNDRVTTFDEIELGYDEESVILEAQRCLNCKTAPCTSGCPLNNYIPEFIKLVTEKKFEEAYNVIRKKSNFPSICSRVCAQEKQCESKCTRGLNGEPVAIGLIERFVTDYHYKNINQNKQNTSTIKDNNDSSTLQNKLNVAVIGSGPSGLACAEDLALLGVNVTIFESTNIAGGIPVYGIPNFRLPINIPLSEVKRIETLGTKFIFNKTAGVDFSIESLFNDGFNAIYISTGADAPYTMGIDGENYKGVYTAHEFLKECKLNNNTFNLQDLSNKAVAVVGGGNVAMDCSRTLVRLGAKKVYNIYRRSEEELPARREEYENAIKEGVEFLLLTNPTKVLSNDGININSVECIKMELGALDEKGRRRPVEIPNSEFTLPIDAIVMAIGSSTNDTTKTFANSILFNKYNTIEVDENNKTSAENIYAGGDVVNGASTVVLAIKNGKNAAKSIYNTLTNK